MLATVLNCCKLPRFLFPCVLARSVSVRWFALAAKLSRWSFSICLDWLTLLPSCGGLMTCEVRIFFLFLTNSFLISWLSYLASSAYSVFLELSMTLTGWSVLMISIVECLALIDLSFSFDILLLAKISETLCVTDVESFLWDWISGRAKEPLSMFVDDILIGDCAFWARVF